MITFIHRKDPMFGTEICVNQGSVRETGTYAHIFLVQEAEVSG